MSRPSSASDPGSEAQLRSDLPLDGPGLVSATDLINQNENHTAGQDFGPPQDASPSTKKVESLRADIFKVPLNITSSHKKIARPSSAGTHQEKTGLSAFTFAQASRKTGNLARPTKPHGIDEHRQATQLEESQHVTAPTPQGLRHPQSKRDIGFDTSFINVLPLNFEESLQAESADKARSVDQSKEEKDQSDSNGKAAKASDSAAKSDHVERVDDQRECQSNGASSVPVKQCYDPGHSEFPSKDTIADLGSEAPSQAQTEKVQIVRGIENITSNSPIDITANSKEPRLDLNIRSVQDKDHRYPAAPKTRPASGHKALDSTRVTKTCLRDKSYSRNGRQMLRNPSEASTDLSEEDLFMLLIQRSRDHKASKMRAAEKQKEMAQTIHWLCQDNDEFRKALKHANEVEAAHVSKIDGQKAITEDLKTRFGKLKSFVNGLSSDLDSFRKDGQVVRKKYEDAERARNDLLNDLKGHHHGLANMDRSVMAVKAAASDLNGSFEALSRTAEQLEGANSELHNQGEMLQLEKMKVARLEAHLETELKSFRQQDEILRGDYHDVADRLTLVLPLIEQLQSRLMTPSESPPELKQCLSKLETIAKNTEKTPADFTRVIKAMNAHAERIAACLEETSNSVGQQKALHDDSSDKILSHLRNILAVFNSQVASQNDCISTKEAKHKVEEQLARTEEIIKSRDHEISSLAAREKFLCEMLPQLKTEIQAFRDNCSPAAKQLEHYRSQADQNRVSMMWANSEKAEALKKLAALEEEFSTKTDLLTDAGKQLDTLNEQKSALTNKIEILEEELCRFDREKIELNRKKIIAQEEAIQSLRMQIDEADTMHRNDYQKIDHLQASHEELKTKLEFTTTQLEASRASMSASEIDNGRLRRNIEELQASRTEAANVPILRAELGEKEYIIQELRSQADQVGQKEQQVKALEANIARLNQEVLRMGKQIVDQQELQGTIETLEKDLQQNAAKVALLQTSVQSVENKADRINTLESSITSKDSELTDLLQKYEHTSQALEDLDRLRLKYDEISERHSNLMSENASLSEVSANNRELRTQLADRDEQLKAYDENHRQLLQLQEENSKKNTELQDLKAEAQKKDAELSSLQAGSKKQEELTLELSKTISQMSRVSQDSVWSESMVAAIDSITELPRVGEVSNPIETPNRTTDDGLEDAQQPDTPEPPRQRQLENRLVVIPESSAAVKGKLAAARPLVGSQFMGTPTIMIPESQPYKEAVEELEEDQDSELSDAPDSSPIKKHRSSFFRNELAEQNVGEMIDEVHTQLFMGVKQSKSRHSRVPNASSRPSTQGEEMLFERQSQKSTPSGPFKSHTRDPTLLQEPTNSALEARFSTPIPPSPADRRVQYGKAAATGHVNPPFARPKGTSPRKLRTMTHPAANIVDPITENTPTQTEGSVHLEAPAAGILKQKHQPNTGAKRQLDSDSLVGSPQAGPTKIAKRNPSNLDIRKPSSASGRNHSLDNQATKGDRSPDLPTGGKKGSVGGRSTQTGGKQKAAKKPRKGSRGDKYGNRFGEAMR